MVDANIDYKKCEEVASTFINRASKVITRYEELSEFKLKGIKLNKKESDSSTITYDVKFKGADIVKWMQVYVNPKDYSVNLDLDLYTEAEEKKRDKKRMIRDIIISAILGYVAGSIYHGIKDKRSSSIGGGSNGEDSPKRNAITSLTKLLTYSDLNNRLYLLENNYNGTL